MVRSTRSDTTKTVSEAILDGLAKDGGLYVFDTLPTLDLNELAKRDNIAIAKHVFHALLDDIPKDAIDRIVSDVYQSDLFQPAPFTMTHRDHHSYLNLYHGETLAFKDMALSVLPHLIEEAKRIHGIRGPSIVLTATSGDTGSAALAGFAKRPDTHVIVLYPADGVSPFQERQMLSCEANNCHVFAVKGNFDECQTIVKELFQSLELKHAQLVSANSINIGRLIPQITYYVQAYFELVKDGVIALGDKIDAIVPTGNFGNIYAAYLAKRMGIPYDKLIIAANTNNVLHDLFQTGTYDIRRELFKTISPSMDIIISSNLERYLFDLVDRKAQRLHQIMRDLKQDGVIQFDLIKQHDTFTSGMADEDDTLATIARTLATDGILIDPHTAVAKHVFDNQAKPRHHTIIVATASPFKFTNAMLAAFNLSTSDDLETSVKRLADHAGVPVPDRVRSVVQPTNYVKHTLSKSRATSTLKKMVGDIDEH